MTDNPTPLWEGDAAPFDGVLIPQRLGRIGMGWSDTATCADRDNAPMTAMFLRQIQSAEDELLAGRPLRAGDRVRCGDKEGQVDGATATPTYVFVMFDDRLTLSVVPTSALTRIGDES